MLQRIGTNRVFAAEVRGNRGEEFFGIIGMEESTDRGEQRGNGTMKNRGTEPKRFRGIIKATMLM